MDQTQATATTVSRMPVVIGMDTVTATRTGLGRAVQNTLVSATHAVTTVLGALAAHQRTATSAGRTLTSTSRGIASAITCGLVMIAVSSLGSAIQSVQGVTDPTPTTASSALAMRSVTLMGSVCARHTGKDRTVRRTPDSATHGVAGVLDQRRQTVCRVSSTRTGPM
jgi:ABC-type nitrate/sulfonate/bicarbonate transport system permease component